MPELPEIETVISGLKSNVLGFKIIDIWLDYKSYLKLPKKEQDFKKLILGRKILFIKRKGKGILFELDKGFYLFVQPRMTGSFIFSSFNIKKEDFLKKIKNEDKFVHLIFFLEKRKALLFRDPRKFGNFFLGTKEKILKLPFLKNLGIDPFSPKFTFKKFLELSEKHNKKILKSFLMDQKVISGIGNIYASEILWKARLFPQRKVESLNLKEKKNFYLAILLVLKRAIRYKGSSISDFRNIYGEKGNYQKNFYVYNKAGKNCKRCGGIIKKVKINGRGTYYCKKCQI